MKTGDMLVCRKDFIGKAVVTLLGGLNYYVDYSFFEDDVAILCGIERLSNRNIFRCILLINEKTITVEGGKRHWRKCWEMIAPTPQTLSLQEVPGG